MGAAQLGEARVTERRTIAPSVHRLARDLADLKVTVRKLASSPRLAYSSIEGGSLDGYDDDGNPTVNVGELPDGTTGVNPTGGPVPPAPTGFDVSGGIRSLVVDWSGQFVKGVVAPLNFARIEIHVSEDPDFVADLVGDVGNSSTFKGTIETPRGGGLVIAGFDPPEDADADTPLVELYVRFFTRSTSGKFSASSPLYGPVSPVVIRKIEMPDFSVTEFDLEDYSISGTKIQTDAITAPKISANAIIAGKISANAIVTANIQAGAVQTANLQANAVTALTIATNAVTALKVDTDAITAGKIAAGAVIAGKIATDAVTANTIAAGAVTASKLTADAIDGKTITGVTMVTSTLTNPYCAIGNDNFTSWSGLSHSGSYVQISGSTGPPGFGTKYPGIMANNGSGESFFQLIGSAWFTDVNLHGLRLFADVLNDGTTTTTATIGPSGQVIRTPPSSMRYKEDLRKYVSTGILDLEVFIHRYKDRETYGDQEFLAVSAEKVAEVGLDTLYWTDADGRPDGVHYERIGVALIPEIRALRDEVAGLRQLVAGLTA